MTYLRLPAFVWRLLSIAVDRWDSEELARQKRICAFILMIGITSFPIVAGFLSLIHMYWAALAGVITIFVPYTSAFLFFACTHRIGPPIAIVLATLAVSPFLITLICGGVLNCGVLVMYGFGAPMAYWCIKPQQYTGALWLSLLVLAETTVQFAFSNDIFELAVTRWELVADLNPDLRKWLLWLNISLMQALELILFSYAWNTFSAKVDEQEKIRLQMEELTYRLLRMDLDDIDLTPRNDASQLERSLFLLVSKLKQWRPFIPATMFLNLTDTHQDQDQDVPEHTILSATSEENVRACAVSPMGGETGGVAPGAPPIVPPPASGPPQKSGEGSPSSAHSGPTKSSSIFGSFGRKQRTSWIRGASTSSGSASRPGPANKQATYATSATGSVSFGNANTEEHRKRSLFDQATGSSHSSSSTPAQLGVNRTPGTFSKLPTSLVDDGGGGGGGGKTFNVPPPYSARGGPHGVYGGSERLPHPSDQAMVRQMTQNIEGPQHCSIYSKVTTAAVIGIHNLVTEDWDVNTANKRLSNLLNTISDFASIDKGAVHHFHGDSAVCIWLGANQQVRASSAILSMLDTLQAQLCEEFPSQAAATVPFRPMSQGAITLGFKSPGGVDGAASASGSGGGVDEVSQLVNGNTNNTGSQHLMAPKSPRSVSSGRSGNSGMLQAAGGGMMVRAALSSGRMYIGNLGQHQRYPLFCGTPLNIAHQLFALSKAIEGRLLMDWSIASQVEYHYDLIPVDIISGGVFPSSVHVFELCCPTSNANTSEWMYEISTPSTARLFKEKFCAAFTLFSEGHITKAHNAFAELLSPAASPPPACGSSSSSSSSASAYSHESTSALVEPYHSTTILSVGNSLSVPNIIIALHELPHVRRHLQRLLGSTQSLPNGFRPYRPYTAPWSAEYYAPQPLSGTLPKTNSEAKIPISRDRD